MLLIIAICIHLWGMSLSIFVKICFSCANLKNTKSDCFKGYMYVLFWAIYKSRWGWIEVIKQFHTIRNIKIEYRGKNIVDK